MKFSDYTPVYVSCFGNLGVHPGVKLGLDWDLLMIEKTKENKKRIKTIRKLLFITPSIAYYHHEASHNGLIIATDLNWRRYSKKTILQIVRF